VGHGYEEISEKVDQKVSKKIGQEIGAKTNGGEARCAE
jgi:hypothetical protein